MKMIVITWIVVLVAIIDINFKKKLFLLVSSSKNRLLYVDFISSYLAKFSSQ